MSSAAGRAGQPAHGAAHGDADRSRRAGPDQTEPAALREERARPGALVIVATPIGNLGDLSPRAREALGAADVVCCEDTRRTRALLTAAGVPAGNRLVSLHAYNEASRVPRLLDDLSEGRTVAVVSDAGTPVVSDPGARLVAAAIDAGFGVTTVPGPSAVLAALAVSGLPTDRFSAEGFLPRKGRDRRRRLEALVADVRTTVLFESPRRLAATLEELAQLAPERAVAICRELTKLHEEVWRGTLAEAATEFASRAPKGEVAVVVAGAGRSPGRAGDAGPSEPVSAGAHGAVDDAQLAGAVFERLAEGWSTRDVADAVAATLGVSRRRAYEAAVAARRRRPPR